MLTVQIEGNKWYSFALGNEKGGKDPKNLQFQPEMARAVKGRLTKHQVGIVCLLVDFI